MGTTRAEHKYSDTLAVALAPSALAARAIAFMVLATLALLAAMPGPVAPRILAATWVVCAGLEAFERIARRRGRAAVRSLRVDCNGEMELAMADGQWRHGELRDGSFVAPWLTVIHWRPPGARFDRTLLVLPDMLPADDFRRLRVLLRWR